MRALLLSTLLVVAAPTLAVADSQAVVLAVDGPDIYVDLGGKDGVAAGAELELLHQVVARDPSTGKTVRDRFSLGTMTIDRAGDHVAIATADGALAGRVAPGDHVRLVAAPTRVQDPWIARLATGDDDRTGSTGDVVVAPPAPTTASERADTEAVHAVWQASLGRSIEDRIARWRELLVAHPDTAYAAAITAEVTSLETQARDRDAAIERAKTGTDRGTRIAALSRALDPRGGAIAVSAPPRVAPGQPIELAFLIRAPAAIGEGALFARKPGDPGFTRIALRSDGDAYLRGVIPAVLVVEPGVEWFVEVTGPDGAATAGLGSRVSPRTIAVDRDTGEPPPATDRSHVRLAVDYVDFDGGLADGFDQYVQAEMDFTYRFIEPIYAFRIGFGTMSGIGGPKNVIDEDPTNGCLDGNGLYRCRRVAFNYVYAELEHRFRPTLAVMLRPQAGLVATDTMPGSEPTRCTDSSDVSECRFTTGLGLRARVRIGEETGTNLVLGAGFTDGVGTVLEARYHWLPARAIPVELSVEVSDQPVPEDFGVRLVGDVGWRGLGWFYPSLRVSMQARDIDHSGFSGGAAMNFEW